MVQFLLSGSRGTGACGQRAWLGRFFFSGCIGPADPGLGCATIQREDRAGGCPARFLLLEGGRKLSYERSFHSEREVRSQRGFWRRALDVIAGEPDFHVMVRPYSVATDSRGRIIVTDPGSAGVHIFDFAQQKYKFCRWRATSAKIPCYRRNGGGGRSRQHLCHRLRLRQIFVFDPNGKFQRAIGSLKGGEGYFKRPTGIAVDSAANHIYATDTLRNKIFMLDLQGNILQKIGKNGTGNVEFNFPTELRLSGDDLMVVGRDELPHPGAGPFRRLSFCHWTNRRQHRRRVPPQRRGRGFAKAICMVDGLWGIVQVFNRRADSAVLLRTTWFSVGQFQFRRPVHRSPDSVSL